MRKMDFLVPKAPKKESKDVNILTCSLMLKFFDAFPFLFFSLSFSILMNKFDGREQWHHELLKFVYLSLS